MRLKATTFVSLVIACTAASAQVYRCPDAKTGKITYSDAPCAEGKQIVRQMTAEERMLNDERADIARQRNQLAREREAMQQQAPTPQPAPSTAQSGTSYECQIAQKNAWGVNKEQKQREADIICYGPERAAQIQAAKAANKPVKTTCVHNGPVSRCVSR